VLGHLYFLFLFLWFDYSNVFEYIDLRQYERNYGDMSHAYPRRRLWRKDKKTITIFTITYL